MAVQGGFLEFSSLLRGRKIAPFCDCITTVAYLRRSGATRSHTPGGGPGPNLSVASDHSPIHYAAVSKAPCVLCYSMVFLQPWGYPRTYAFPPITLITSVLLKLRASHTCVSPWLPPFCPQEDGLQLCWTFPQTLQRNYPNVEIYCTNRISIGFKTISLFFVWRRGSSQATRQSGRLLWDSGWPSCPL